MWGGIKRFVSEWSFRSTYYEIDTVDDISAALKEQESRKMLLLLFYWRDGNNFTRIKGVLDSKLLPGQWRVRFESGPTHRARGLELIGDSCLYNVNVSELGAEEKYDAGNGACDWHCYVDNNRIPGYVV